MIGACNTHASQKEDKQLKDQLTQFRKQLDKAKEFSLTCSNLIKQIQAINPEDLVKRGVAAADITAFEAQVALFKGNVPKIQSAKSQTSTELSKSELLTVKGCAIVSERIAPTLMTIKDKIPTFYTSFEKASTIRKPATTSSQLKFNIVNDTTGEKIEGAIIRDGEQTFDGATALKQPSTAKIQTGKTGKITKAAKAAKAAMKNTLQSDSLEIVKDGYETYQLAKPKFKKGKITTITVRMIPTAQPIV